MRHGYLGGGGRVFFANYTLILSYIYPIFLYNFRQKWQDKPGSTGDALQLQGRTYAGK